MKRYTAKQWGLAAAAGALFVLIAVVAIPYYIVTTAMPFVGGAETQSVKGTSDPFNGTWTLVLGLAGGLAASAGVFASMGAQNRRLIYGASALLYGVAAILAITDVTRDLPTASGLGFSASRGVGPYSALTMSLLSLIAAAMAAKESGAGGAGSAPSPPAS